MMCAWRSTGLSNVSWSGGIGISFAALRCRTARRPAADESQGGAVARLGTLADNDFHARAMAGRGAMVMCAGFPASRPSTDPPRGYADKRRCGAA